ncbi:hypothetical protein E2C01_063632 [Portunus trituberculatus]|uniref:Uncharacterized protein n=1 Tax=Portunus trituberculatus TaxID=210409 RepID=A0A5B7HL06_PORTR|nr:hypothetical protein [Portunus trituberculatus]
MDDATLRKINFPWPAWVEFAEVWICNYHTPRHATSTLHTAGEGVAGGSPTPSRRALTSPRPHPSLT